MSKNNISEIKGRPYLDSRDIACLAIALEYERRYRIDNRLNQWNFLVGA